MNKNSGMCKDRIGFYFWSDNNDPDKYFFKIMAGGFRERLLVLGSGWEEFVSVHDLNMGDFLVFKYDGSSHLKVLIFDPSGCEKSSSVVMKKATHKYERNEPVGMESQCNDLAMKSSSNEINISSVQKDRSKQGNMIIHVGSSSCSSDPSADDATLLCSNKDDQRAHAIPRYIVPCGTSLSSSMKKKLKEKVGAIHSEIPVYVCVIKKSNIYGPARCMNLSREYADTYLPFEEQVLLLQCNGKKWQVRCVKARKRKHFFLATTKLGKDKSGTQLPVFCTLCTSDTSGATFCSSNAMSFGELSYNIDTCPPMSSILLIMQSLGKNCRVCMEWQEHCYWSHMADEKKHFFKVLAGDFTESIGLPSRFANNFNGHISEVVTLKSPSGKIWSIGVCSDNDEVVFRSGWKEFVSTHSIEEGDYLLFKYTGVSAFDVLIFDSSGCEKTSSHFSNNHCYERIPDSVRVEGHGCHRFNGGKNRMPQSVPSDDDGNNAQLEVTLHKNSSRNYPKESKQNLSNARGR
ncbi:hypothetical protein PR202_gb11752 [Eleusine coracana subsp. coracana]|uniref:TF-B3 domain-containing protein n=1 Tax=Eleusine coracana subsp. coracana TaxID=191504 RepID=A0AAV5ENL6_ELECO|nr:hypothetical protein PR202_gb11752 [Eleusine coracana subsp. coracana]